MKLKQVNDVPLPDGNSYPGWCVNNYGGPLPQSCGKTSYVSVSVWLRTNDFNGCSGDEDRIYISTLAIKRQTHNAGGTNIQFAHTA
jgi:hypothetical protein